MTLTHQSNRLGSSSHPEGKGLRLEFGFSGTDCVFYVGLCVECSEGGGRGGVEGQLLAES